jgi:hypothetical protein
MGPITQQWIDNFLKNLGCELWPGEAFYLTDPESRAKAASWFLETYDKIIDSY